MQTYDSWAMKGPSAYCGGLWLATLSVAVDMAVENGEDIMAKEWSAALEKARAAYQEKLWNVEKKFFKFDATERGKYFNSDGLTFSTNNSKIMLLSVRSFLGVFFPYLLWCNGNRKGASATVEISQTFRNDSPPTSCVSFFK